jgi:hypothetical protein
MEPGSVWPRASRDHRRPMRHMPVTGRNDTPDEELPMIPALILTVPVLAVYAMIGRLAIPERERLPLRELGWAGWVHTLRRSLAVLADCAHPAGTRAL